ncbi:unnamed protein product [Urochloa humidicola]
MGRTLHLVVVALVISSLLLMAVPPALSAAFRPPVKIGRYTIISARMRKQIGNFLKKHALDIIQDVLSTPAGQKQGDNNNLDTKTADTAGLYIFNLSVGTPVQNFSGILDITSELVWAQCECSGDACLPPPATTFQASASDTFAGVPCASQTCQSTINQPCGNDPAANCTYQMLYNDYTNTTGYLANDTFTFGQTPVPGVVFGCSDVSSGDFSGASGVLGFSKGNLSLVSQLQLSWFSYLLASDSDVSGSDNNLLQFGDDAVPETENSRSTPLVNNSVYPDLYFVKLTGIMVDGQQLNGIPAGTFDLQPDGSGGAFLSTTIPVTYLEKAAYNVVKQAFLSRIKAEAVNGSALGLDLCYTLQPKDEMTVPKLALVFDGTGATMELKKHNYFYADNATNLECLTILPIKGGSLLGSLLQTDTNMAYDIHGGRLIFDTVSSAPQKPHLKVSLMVALQLIAWALLF